MGDLDADRGAAGERVEVDSARREPARHVDQRSDRGADFRGLRCARQVEGLAIDDHGPHLRALCGAEPECGHRFAEHRLGRRTLRADCVITDEVEPSVGQAGDRIDVESTAERSARHSLRISKTQPVREDREPELPGREPELGLAERNPAEHRLEVGVVVDRDPAVAG
ncbi:MAG: hypothetical protein RL562_15 [Planctomycetota bacterium]